MVGKIVAISAGALVVLVLVAGLIANAWLQGWLRGPAFRGLVEAQTGRALRGDARFEPFVWSGPQIFSPDLTVSGKDGEVLDSLRAQQIRADVNWRAAFSGSWNVRRIDITRLDLALSAPGAASPAEALAAETAAVEEVAQARAAIPSWLPSRFDLDVVVVADANAEFPPGGAIRNTSLTIQPEGAGWIFDARGGKYDPPAVLGPLDIEDIRVRLQQDVVYLTDARLRASGAGRVTANGEFGGAEEYRVQLEWQNIDVSEVLDATWRDRLTGLVHGEARIRPAKTADAAPVEGNFSLGEGTLTGLPLQEEIARFTRSPQFARMPVHELSSRFKTNGDVTEFEDFVLESKGLLRMEGRGTLGPDTRIAGTFRVGVTPQTLQWLPGSQERVFTVSEGGYLWTDVEVGGTLDRPTEDLSNRLARAMGEHVIDTGVELIESAPEKTREVIDRAIDILSPLLR